MKWDLKPWDAIQHTKFGLDYINMELYVQIEMQSILVPDTKLKKCEWILWSKLIEMYLFWLSYLLIFHSDHILFDRVIQE